jgi:hypothetical protein
MVALNLALSTDRVAGVGGHVDAHNETNAAVNTTGAAHDALDVRVGTLEDLVGITEDTATPLVLRHAVVTGTQVWTNPASLTLTTEASVQIGDTLIVIHGNDDGFASAMDPPSGDIDADDWELIVGADGGLNKTHLNVWRATATTAGAQDVVLDHGSGGDDIFAAVIVGVGDVTVEAYAAATGTPSASHVAPSVTAQTAVCTAYHAWISGPTAITNYEMQPGVTEVVELDQPTFTTFAVGVGDSMPSIGATGTTTATSSVTSQDWCAVTLLLRAAVESTGTIPTLEELQDSARVGDVSATGTYLLGVANLDMRVGALSLAATGAITASDTNYWDVALLRYRDGAAATIATKSTTTVAPDEGVAAGTAWTFDLIAFDSDQYLHKGDVLAVTFTKNGAPSNWTGTVASWRYEPGVIR